MINEHNNSIYDGSFYHNFTVYMLLINMYVAI